MALTLKEREKNEETTLYIIMQVITACFGDGPQNIKTEL